MLFPHILLLLVPQNVNADSLFATVGTLNVNVDSSFAIVKILKC